MGAKPVSRTLNCRSKAATLIIQAGCLLPGTTRPRQPEPLGYGGGGRESGARVDPGGQASRPARADPDINRNRLIGNVPARQRNAYMSIAAGKRASGHTTANLYPYQRANRGNLA